MSTIYGVNSQTYQRLPAEDQAAIRASHLARQEQPAPPQRPSATPMPAPSVTAATTPQAAVNALHALPVPNNRDLAQLPFPPADLQSMIDGRNAVYNATRAEAAQAALDRLEPQRSDFDALPPATANMEYQQARQAWQQSPYVAELERIVEEAQANPARIPAYLTGTGGSRADLQTLAPEQVRSALGMLGIELPADAAPELLDAGRELLDTVPDDMLGMLINPGSQVSFTHGTGGGTPNLLGPTVRYNLDVEMQTSLGDVETGVGFSQTQQFEASVQVQGGAAFDISRSTPQQIYKWADRLSNLPDAVTDRLGRIPGFDRLDNLLGDAKRHVDDIPALRTLLKGFPVSGSYESFAGARLDYEAVVTPGQGALLADGDLDGLPNPLDPLNMAEGNSVLLRGQQLQGSAFELNWKAFTVGGTHTDLSGMGFGVTRLEGSMVEVYSGPVDTVENTAFFGIGRQDTLAVGVGNELSMETREMRIARIDLATEEGQAAYQAFINGGQVPAWSPPGVPLSGTTEVFSHEYASFLGIKAGGFTLGGASDANGSITRTTWTDGTAEFTNTYTSTGGVTSEIRYSMDAAGEPDYANATWTVVRADLHPTSASYLRTAYDASMVNQFPDSPQHAQMTLSTDDLMDIRDRARAYVVGLSGQETLDNLDSGRVDPWWASQEQALAVATTPEEVFAVLTEDRHGGAVIESLLGISMATGELPGEFRMIGAS